MNLPDSCLTETWAEPARHFVRERIEVTTDEIEELLHSKFAKGGWDVQFDWSSGQWPKMIVTRTKTEIKP